MTEQGLTSPSTHYRSFRRRVFPVNHLHWYWQANKNNQATEHTNNIKITQPKKSPRLTAQHIHQKKPRLKDRTDRAWFSRLVRHPGRKRNGSILTTPKSARGRLVKAVMCEMVDFDRLRRRPAIMSDNITNWCCSTLPDIDKAIDKDQWWKITDLNGWYEPWVQEKEAAWYMILSGRPGLLANCHKH